MSVVHAVGSKLNLCASFEPSPTFMSTKDQDEVWSLTAVYINHEPTAQTWHEYRDSLFEFVNAS